jgi:hypothetical protein
MLGRGEQLAAGLGTEYPMPIQTQWAGALAARPGGCYCLTTRKNRISWRIAQYRSYGSYKTYLADESHFSADTQRIRWRSSEKSLRAPGIIRRGGVAGWENRLARAASVVNRQPSTVNCQLSTVKVPRPACSTRRVGPMRCSGGACPAGGLFVDKASQQLRLQAKPFKVRFDGFHQLPQSTSGLSWHFALAPSHRTRTIITWINRTPL